MDGFPPAFPPSHLGPKTLLSDPQRKVEWDLGGDERVSPIAGNATAHEVHEPVCGPTPQVH